MRRPLLSDQGQRRFSNSREGDRVHRQKRQRARHFSLESLESRCLLSNITPYLLPTTSGGVEPAPVDITSAAGKLWFSEQVTNAVGMLNPADPTSPQAFSLGTSGAPGDITTGPDGNVWFTEPAVDKIGVITTSGTPQLGTPITLPGGETPQSLAAGVTKIWYIDSSNNALGSFNPSTRALSSEAVLGTDQNGNSMVGLGTDSEIVVDSADGLVWFTEYNSSTGQGAIGSYNPGTNAWAQYLLGSGQKPYSITVGPSGNIWFSEAVPDSSLTLGYSSSALGMINASDPSAPTEYPLSTTSNGEILPYRIVEGPDGNIWYTGNNAADIAGNAGLIGVLNLAISTPSSPEFATESIPSATTGTPVVPDGITVGPSTQNSNSQSIWLTDNLGSAVDEKLLATHLVVTTPPAATVQAGATIPVSITAEDALNNVDPIYNGSVTLTVTNGPSILPVQASQGVASFTGLKLDTAGGYSLTGTANGLTATPATSFNVTAAAASKLVIVQSPTNPVTTGQAFVVKVEAEDAYNNPVLNYDGSSVSIALLANPGSSTLGGNGPVPFVNGVATFSQLSLNNPGTGYTLQASDTTSGLTPVTTNGFNVTSTAVNQATQLDVVGLSTTSVLAGSPFSVEVAALTSGKAVASSFTGTVNLIVFYSSSGGSVGGTTTTPASGGIALFPSVTLSLPGTYILEATTTGLSSGYTAAITVLAPPQVSSASVVSTQKTNPRTHKPTGKPVITGYQFTFNTPMSSSITSSTDYLVQVYVPAKGRGKSAKPAHYQTISSFSLTGTSSTTVKVLTGTKTTTTFKSGGRITLIGTGISSSAGALLGNNVVYNISAGGRSISLA